MISEEQNQLWEEQFREDVYPSFQEGLTSDEEKKEDSFVEDSFECNDCDNTDPGNKASTKTSLNETEYFDDSDDEHLQAVADIFQSTATPLKKDVSDKGAQQNSPKSEIIIPDSDEDSPVRMRRRNVASRFAPARRQLSFSDDEGDEDFFQKIGSKTSKSRPLNSLSSLASSDDNDNDDEVLTQRALTQGVIHWQSFQEGSQDTEEIECDEENFEVVSQWVTETQLNRKIDSNDAAQRIIKRRAARKSNPFLDDEAGDAYDDEECFYDDYESQQVHDTSLADFIADEPASDHGPTRHHLQSLLSQTSQPFMMPQMFIRRAPKTDLSILSDTTEENVDDEEDDWCMDDSFICDDIEYKDDVTPEKTNQTQQMRLRSKRLVERRRENHGTPDKPIVKRRRRAVIESPD